jgi:hypoxanthine phosphoribosyltransferase
MKTVRIKDKEFRIYLTAEQIEEAVSAVAARINADLAGKNPIFVCVLNGAFIFAADLYRHVTIPSQITFMRMKSYEGMQSTGKVKTIASLHESMVGRTVVVVEDIVDTGYTMQRMIAQLKDLGASEVYVSTLLRKPKACKVPDLKIDYAALEIPNDFIVGYGLDYDEEGRNLPDIYVLND